MSVTYVVHRAGRVGAKSADPTDVFDASVLGYVVVPKTEDALAQAKAKVEQTLHLEASFLIHWDISPEVAKTFAAQRGEIG